MTESIHFRSIASLPVPFVEIILCVVVESLQVVFGLREGRVYSSKFTKGNIRSASFVSSLADSAGFAKAFTSIREKGCSYKPNFLKFIKVIVLKVIRELNHYSRGILRKQPWIPGRGRCSNLNQVSGNLGDTFFVVATAPSYQFRQREVSFNGHGDGLSMESISIPNLLREIENCRHRHNDRGPTTESRHPFSKAVLIGLSPRFPPDVLGNAPRFTPKPPDAKRDRCDQQTEGESFRKSPAGGFGIFHILFTLLPRYPLTRMEGTHASPTRVVHALILAKIIKIKLQLVARKWRAAR